MFDEQGKTGQRCAEAYPRMKRYLAPQIREVLGGIPTFRNDKDFVPLQAADGVAWVWRRHGEQESLSRFSATMLHPFVSGLAEIPATLTTLTYGDLLVRRDFLSGSPPKAFED